MGRARIVGVLVAVVGCALVACAGASAEAPEFGRCLKQATKAVSNYDSARCVKLASEGPGTEAEQLKKGNFQWFSGVVKKKFTSAIRPGTLVTLETVLGAKVTCTGETSTGEYTSATTVGKVSIKFTGCENPKVGCESEGAGDDNINTGPLAGSLGFETITEDTPAKDHLALELHAEGGNVLEFFCAGLKYVVRGSVLYHVAANAMQLTPVLKFTQSKGKQKPEHFAGGLPGERILETSLNNGPFAQAGLSFAGTQTNEEKVEARTVN